MARLKHVLVIPLPAQGQVTPLLKLSHCIADYGVKVTFVYTESIHAKVMAANPGLEEGSDRITFVAIPDGLETDEERKDFPKVLESMSRVMPGHLQELIEKVKEQSNGNEDEQISFMIVDLTTGWALEVAERMGIGRAGFWAASVLNLALIVHIPKLIEGGVIDNNGIALNNDLITISKDLPSGSLWDEDSTCSNWLDQHPSQSVIYLAFGSSTVFSPEQFSELAHALKQIARPFLWVVRPALTRGPVTEFHEGFLQRVRNYGKVARWASQEEVLAHPSVACFFTHCGWNSTLEGLSNGVPLLCWPHFGDQFLNRSYICDVWRVGLGVDGDENGFITRHEVRDKVLAVLGSGEIRANCLRMKEMAGKSVSEGGSSLKNLQSFIELMKA
ncbi:hypothetical protein BT93_K0106 [Corymbia citriodora subsp. variegata]|nr:hypothetical protein BT93_K0106 [Corymbia citriodora subsp. variegata]